MTVWNNIDDRYFNFVKPKFTDFALFQSIFSFTVWNTIIDDRKSNVGLYIEMKPYFLILPLFKAFSL